MKRLGTLMIMVVTTITLPAQDFYKVKHTRVELINGQVVHGELVSINLDSMVLNIGQKPTSFKAKEIKTIRIKTKGQAGRGALTGAVAMSFVGLSAGAKSESLYSVSDPMGFALVGAVGGCLVGAGVGAAMPGRKFNINGDRMKLLEVSVRLKSSIKK